MKRFSLSLCFLLLAGAGAAPVIANGATELVAEHRILEQIHLAESIYREDVVQDALERLYRIAPGHPEGLAAELRQAVRQGNTEHARQLLEQLKQTAPQSLAYQSGRILLRLSTPEAQSALARARLYSAAGRVDEARHDYDALFEGIYPTTDLAVEYWQLRAREPNGRPSALNALSALLKASPQHAGLLGVVANYLFAENQPDQARFYLHRLAEQSAYRVLAADREYEYLLTLPVSNRSAKVWSEFAGLYPDLPVGQKAQDYLRQHQALLGDATWRAGQEGLRLVEAGSNNAQALASLKRAVAAYPDDVELIGALGLAYLRVGNRLQALHYFEMAKNKELREDKTSRWVSLIQTTRYWLLLQQASQAADKQDWTKAQRLYAQANRQHPSDVFALVGLGDTALAMGQHDAAWRHFQKALRLAPRDTAAQRGVARYLATLPPEQAMQVLNQMPAAQQQFLADTRRGLQLDMLKHRAEQAQAREQWEEASHLLAQAQDLDLADPWLSYRLALALRRQGLESRALDAFQKHLASRQGDPVSHYAHALLLSSVDQLQAALDTLDAVPATVQTTDIRDMKTSLLERQQIQHAVAIYDTGRENEAIALLENSLDSTAARLQVAAWSQDSGDHAKALSNYAAILRREPDNLDARLGQLETWAAQGKLEAVRHALSGSGLVLPDDELGVRRRVAALWLAVGDKAHARQLLEKMAAQETAPNPLLYRDLARITSADDPQRALNLYAKAMQDEGILPADAASQPRDDIAFTRATRAQDEDNWLRRGVRREAEALYWQETPTLTLHHDRWWRSDGTPGLSELDAGTTMMHLDYPIRQGKAYLRADHVRMDAGTFSIDGNGLHDERFGTCSFGARDVGGNWQALPGCGSGLSQQASGTSFALGWQGERLAFDIGRTPQGFAVQNWVGGISYKGSLQSTGWTLTASRRPMSNSLLSFAGTQDPRTGITWGGVVATGLSLGLSWDQGGANGVWADLSHHRLTGKNVADNHRTRLMAGYYRRLIDRADVSLTAGVNAMHWRYQKDLGEYTLGHGGYYSPQQYSSVSLPVSYARRTADWSFMIEGSVSVSTAKSKDTSYHPLAGLVSGPARDMYKLGVSAAALDAANRAGGGSSNGVGYSIRAIAERRLNNHWVLGGGIDWQHSKDYSPSRAMLYLRYTFEPWQGNLKLRPTPLEPYADFK
ncbi:cellulose biosynthesis protein BcsC [Alcaligenaceae bacterium]|nr:cellulose biosynthesis protein BcsC [Alcaligenaceae bacterium]